jgi:hypothetical protein
MLITGYIFARVSCAILACLATLYPLTLIATVRFGNQHDTSRAHARLTASMHTSPCCAMPQRLTGTCRGATLVAHVRRTAYTTSHFASSSGPQVHRNRAGPRPLPSSQTFHSNFPDSTASIPAFEAHSSGIRTIRHQISDAESKSVLKPHSRAVYIGPKSRVNRRI